MKSTNGSNTGLNGVSNHTLFLAYYCLKRFLVRLRGDDTRESVTLCSLKVYSNVNIVLHVFFVLNLFLELRQYIIVKLEPVQNKKTHTSIFISIVSVWCPKTLIITIIVFYYYRFYICYERNTIHNRFSDRAN